MLRLVVLPSVVLALCMAALPADAETDAYNDAQTLVRTKVEELRSAVLRDAQLIAADPNHAIVLVDQIVSPHIDAARSGKLILGKHWRDATASQRQGFIDNFKRLLLRTYAIHVSDYTDAQVVYLPPIEAGSDGEETMVRTRVTRGGKPPADVNYRMHRTETGWKVYDVLVDGISIVASFRSAVDAEIGQYGIDGLISRLSAKVDKPLSK